MRRKNPNNPSKFKILIEGFKLFTEKSLGDITFSDLERVTGLSRGAILYHFKTKEQIFSEVVETFVTNKENNLPTIDNNKSLWGNIQEFILRKKEQQNYFSNIGIVNINRAYIHIAANAMTFSEEIINKTLLRRNREIEYWRTLLIIAINRCEIREDINVELYIQIFMDLFYGYSYTCMATTNGYDLDYLQEQYYQIYLSIKRV